MRPASPARPPTNTPADLPSYSPNTPPPDPATHPRAFFQLEMQGGIFQACRSSTVSLRGGECSTGTGGDGGPRSIFVSWCLGGSMGSTCI